MLAPGVTAGPVLVVDLDGTLVKTDMLHETFWSALSANWTAPFGALRALSGGRARLKRWLAGAGAIDVSLLPYNQAVLDYVTRWRAAGGHTALVTAADQGLADRIAAHLGLFDEVRGSDGTENLKGPAKARFLTDRYGTGGYTYMGDSTADLPVWQAAAKAVTVNAPASLRESAGQVTPEVEHLGARENGGRAHLRALRPHQWLKNVLVFLPMLASHWVYPWHLLMSVLAFLAFCCVASSVYVLNDLLDLASDRAHPSKRRRPFASGDVPITHSLWLVLGPLTLGALIALVIGWQFAVVLGFYFILTSAYSLWLKQVVVLDICTLACLYMVRILAGGQATNIGLSIWLIAFAVFFFFALAAVKRQAELAACAARGAEMAPGRGYYVKDLTLVMQMAIASGYISVLVLALYLDSPAVEALYNEPRVLFGACLVLLYWISRTVLIAHRGQMNEDPVVFAVKDRVSRICVLLIFTCALLGILLP